MSSLVDLPVEILHRIFDDLDLLTLHRTLRCVCRHLCAAVYSYNRYELNLSVIPQLHLEQICHSIGMENIISLVVAARNEKEDEKIDLFLSLFDSSQFTRLRSLALLDVTNDRLNQFSSFLTTSPLTGLVVRFTGLHTPTSLPILSAVLARVTLRKLHLHTNGICRSLSWPDQCTSLLHLQINDCTSQHYRTILWHCSQLRTLVIGCWETYGSDNSASAASLLISHSYLSSLTITEFYSSFNEIHALLSLTPSLIYLRLMCSMRGCYSILDGNRWEELIENKLPQLRDLDFRFRFHVSSYIPSMSLHSILSSFRTPFWLEKKKWFMVGDCLIRPSYGSQVVIHNMPMNVNDDDLAIRYEASCHDNQCYFLNNQPNQHIRLNEEKSVIEISFVEKNIRSHEIFYLACALEHNKTIINLNVSRNRIGEEGAQQLADVLRLNKTLQRLNVSCCQMGKEGARHLADALKVNRALVELEFGGNQIGQQGAEYLIEALQHNTTLQKLWLGGNEIEAIGIAHMMDALQNNRSIFTLCLQNNVIDKKGLEYVLDGLRKNMTVTMVDLSGNQIDATDAQDLADVLQLNTTITTLILRDNEIRDGGMRYLADALKINKALKTLNLRMNNINDDGAEYLADALRINTGLRMVDISKNRVTGFGIRYLAEALQKNTVLYRLELGQNEVGIMGTKHIAEMLQVNSTLMRLGLCDNRIRDKGVEYLTRALKMNKTLMKLDIKSNQISDDGAQLLFHTLQTHQISVNVDLRNNPVSSLLLQSVDQWLSHQTWSRETTEEY